MIEFFNHGTLRSQLSFEPHPFIRPPSRSRVYLCPFRGPSGREDAADAITVWTEDCPGIYVRPDGIVYTGNVKGVSDPGIRAHCAEAIGSPSTGSLKVSKACDNGNQAPGCCTAAPDGGIKNPGVTGDMSNTLPSSGTSWDFPTCTRLRDNGTDESAEDGCFPGENCLCYSADARKMGVPRARLFYAVMLD